MDTNGRLLEVLRNPAAIENAHRYYDDDEDRPAFSGSYFEVLGGRGDADGVKDVITPQDLVAITTLSVRLTGHGAVEVLVRRSSEISDLLSAIPTSATPWTDDGQALLRGEKPQLLALWQLFCGVRGPVTAGKLCARKRPALVPIWDRVVQSTLKPAARQWWSTVADLARDDEVSAEIHRVHSMLAPVAEERRKVELTPLRAMDIAVWMYGRRSQQGDEET